MFSNYSIILALLFFAESIADFQDEEKVIEAYVTNKCSKNGGANALKYLKNGVEDAEMCLLGALLTLRENDPEHICGEFRSTIYSCLVTLTDTIEPCLDNVEKFLPNFITTFYNSTFDEHCKNGGEKLEDHYEVLNKVECKTVGNAENYIFEKCFGKSTVLKDFEDLDFVIPKNLFCGYFEHANQCAIDFVKEYCDADFAEFVESHLQPTKNWCDNYVENEERFVELTNPSRIAPLERN